MLDKSNGFTHAGLVRINESIRMFVWALLGAQSQTRVEILKVGTGFDAQKQFLVNIQDAINSPIDLPTTQPATIQGTPTKKSLPEPVKHQTVQTKNQPIVISTKEAMQHEDNKTALIVGSIVIGIVALTIYGIY